VHLLPKTDDAADRRRSDGSGSARASGYELNLIRSISNMGFVQEPRDKNFPDKEDCNTDADVADGHWEQAAARQEGKKRFGNLIKESSAAARRQVQAAFDEAREEIANHRHASDNNPNPPTEAKKDRCDSGQQNCEDNSADRLGLAKQWFSVDEIGPVVERNRQMTAKELRGEHRHAVGDREQNGQLQDQQRLCHGPLNYQAVCSKEP